MQTLIIASMICNLVLLGCYLLALDGWRRAAKRYRMAAGAAKFLWRLSEWRQHHLRKANKGLRRKDRLVKRERRDKEALVNLLAMDGTTVKFHPSREVGVLLIRGEPEDTAPFMRDYQHVMAGEIVGGWSGDEQA